MQIIHTEYRAVNIDKIKINGNTYTNYGAYSFIWEKSYFTSPTRSGRGVIGNLNSYSTFLVGHFTIDFSIISIDDYRSIMRQHYEQNEFVVECYDPIYNEYIKLKMYFATEEMAKLFIVNKKIQNKTEWENWLMVVGVQDYKLEMISTNNDLDLVSVVYHLNPPTDTGYLDQTIGENDVYKGEDLLIGGASDFQTETFGGAYKFTKWNTSPNGGDLGNYMDGYAYTINNDLVLYAQWESATDHLLTFNYGLADPVINESANTYETNRVVVQGKSIGLLPIPETPTVKIDNTIYYPYKNGAWYKTPTKAPNSVPISSNELYWLDRDSTIYLLYDTETYSITYFVDGELHSTESAVEYKTLIPLPQLVKSGFTFDGWYTTSDFKDGTKASGTMPPYPLTLYARWVENK